MKQKIINLFLYVKQNNKIRILILLSLLVFIFLGLTYFKLYDCAIRQPVFNFSENINPASFSLLQKVKIDPSSTISISIILIQSAWNNLKNDKLFSGFLFVSIFFLLDFFIVLFYTIMSRIYSLKKKVIFGALYFITSLVLFFLIAFSPLFGVSIIAKIQAKNEINTLYLDLVRSLNSENGIIIGGAPNIAKALQDKKVSLTKIQGDVDDKNIFFAYADETWPDQINLVRNTVIPFIIKQQSGILPKINVNVVLFPNGLLAARDFSQEDVRILIPIMSRQAIEKKFPEYIDNFSKNEPGISVLSEQSYNEFQTKKMEETKQDLKVLIDEINQEMSTVNSYINRNNSALNEAASAEKQLSKDKEKYVSDLQDTYDKYCKGSLSEEKDCKDLKKTIASNKQYITEAKNEISQYKSDIKSANAEAIALKQKAVRYLSTMRDILQQLENNPIIAEYQAGIFYEAENAIYIKYSPEEKNFGRYFSVGTHEYAHALSYKQNEFWSITLEEAMTEYVMGVSMIPLLPNEEDLKKIQIGYIDEILVLKALFDQFGKENFEKLYFTDKSTTSLEKLLKQKFSDKNDLDVFEKNLEALFYLPLEDRENRDKTVKMLTDMLNGKA